MPIQPFVKDGILTVSVQDERLVEPTHIARLFDDVNELLGKSSEDFIILDFSAVEFMSSSALGKLVQLQKKVTGDYRAQLKLAGICPEIYEVFKITRLNKVFDIAADEATARKAFQKKSLFR